MPTLKDIAQACGVSQSTVSQVLNHGGRPVRSITRERILQVARSLDYYPNAVAQGLARKRMNSIGMAFLHQDRPTHENPFLMMILDGVLNVSTRHRQSAMLFTIKNWEAIETSPEIGDGRCDGILLVVSPMQYAMPEILLRRKIPFVLVSAQSRTQEMPSVDVDNVSATRELTEYLLGMGHQRIAFVQSEHSALFSFASEREGGYRQAMQSANLTARLYTLQEAEAANYTLPASPTALICTHDHEALSVMAYLQRQGISVPGNVSVVGFDDIPEARTSSPPLTTVSQPVTLIGERAAEMLLEIINDPATPPRREILPTKLMVRQSAAPPPADRA